MDENLGVARVIAERVRSGRGGGPPVTDAAVPMTLRRQKRNQRRERVFASAIELFVQQGFEKTSMDDIAARAGLGRTTVFNHYPRKTMFLEDWTQRRRARAAQAFAEVAGAATTPMLLRALLDAYLGELVRTNEENRVETAAIVPMCARETPIVLDHPLTADFAAIVEAASTDLRPAADAQLIGRLLALGYFSAIARWAATDPEPFDLGDEVARLLDVVLDGALADWDRRS